MQQPPQRQEVDFQSGTVKGLAIAQFVIGCGCIILGIVAHALYYVVYWWSHVHLYEATGFIEVWTPIPFVVAGILGILAANQRTSGLVNSHMVMSILSTIAAFVLFVCACVYANQIWTHIVLAVLSFTEFVLAIMSSVYSGTCCRTRSQGVILAQPQSGLVVVTTTGPSGPVVYQQQHATQQAYQPWVVQQGMQPAVYPATYGQDTAMAPAVYPATYNQDGAPAPVHHYEAPPYSPTAPATEPVKPPPYM